MSAPTGATARAKPAKEAMAADFVAALARHPTASTDAAAAGRDAVTESRKAEMATVMAKVPGANAVGRADKRARDDAETAVLASGMLCSPALVHGAPEPVGAFMFARPAEPFLAPASGARTSRTLLRASAPTLIVDGEGNPVPLDQAAATQFSASATAGASVAQGASLDVPRSLADAARPPERSTRSDRAGAAKRQRDADDEADVTDSDGDTGAGARSPAHLGDATGLQLAEAQADSAARGLAFARASGAATKDEALRALANDAASERALMTAVPRAPVVTSLDDYLGLVGRIFYREPETGVSSDPDGGFVVLRRSVLGRLTTPLRRPTVLDRWAPYEVALFESSICLFGKDFNAMAELMPGKTDQDVAEFYYLWKNSKNYARWRATFRHPASRS